MVKSTSAWEDFKKQFPKGTRVQLNVGGPTMAVSGQNNLNEQIGCQWFSGKKLESGLFAPETLVLVKDDDEKKESS